MMVVARSCGIVALALLPAIATAADFPSAAIDYAVGTCLTQRGTGPLRDEGYSLGSIAIHDLGLSPLDLDKVRSAVRDELGRRPMTTVHVDGPVDRSDKPALLAHCLEISRSAPVRAALSRLRPGPARR